MTRRLIRVVVMQLGWLVCVLSAAAGAPGIGVAVVTLIVAIYFSLWMDTSRTWTGEFALFLIAGTLGFLLDSSLVHLGQIRFPEAARWGSPSTVWMAALWVNFATIIGVLPKPVYDHISIAILFGFVGGPLAYFAGQSIGAIEITTRTGLPSIGAVWALATPILIFLYKRFGRDQSPLEVVS